MSHFYKERAVSQPLVANVLPPSGISLLGRPQPLQQPPLGAEQGEAASVTYHLYWCPSGGRSFLSFSLGLTHLQAFSLRRKPSCRSPGDRRGTVGKGKHGLGWPTIALSLNLPRTGVK